jgi:twinkle protein
LGGGNKEKQNWLENESDNLDRFDEILLCLDQDKDGFSGAREIMARLGGYRCRLVELPLNDAKECLTNGVTSEDIKYFIDNAISLDPKQLTRPQDYTKLAYEIINPSSDKFLGYKLGWKKFGNSILFRESGLSLWTGYNGHGKSLFLGQVMLNMIDQGAKVCIASFELYPEEIMARLYLQASAQSKPCFEFLQKIDSWLSEKLYLYNLVGTANLKEVLEVFAYARCRYGVDVFLIDSLSTLNVAENDYEAQKKLVEMLRDFKVNRKCHIHLVVHPRKPPFNNEEPPSRYDMRGGAIMSDLADNCFSVWRNKKKEEIDRGKARGEYPDLDELQYLKSHDTVIKCDKNRHGIGKFKEGKFGFYFDESTFQYLEGEDNLPRIYVDF